MDIDHAIARCATSTRAHSRTFYLGSRLFPHEQRRAVSVVYAVCRAGDDAVDEAPSRDEAVERLAAWSTGVERAFAGRPRDDEPLELALAWSLDRYDIPKGAFDELHRGLASDLESTAISDTSSLMEYCRRVAGVVGLMVIPVTGYDGGADTRLRAVELGCAMQLTNILRDVGEDLGRDRCYLPESWLARYGVSRAELCRGEMSDGYRALVSDLAARAHELYRNGWEGIPRLHGSAPAAVGVAALAYERILHKLAENGWNNLTRRAHLRSVERLALIPRALLGAYAGG